MSDGMFAHFHEPLAEHGGGVSLPLQGELCKEAILGHGEGGDPAGVGGVAVLHDFVYLKIAVGLLQLRVN